MYIDIESEFIKRLNEKELVFVNDLFATFPDGRLVHNTFFGFYLIKFVVKVKTDKLEVCMSKLLNCGINDRIVTSVAIKPTGLEIEFNKLLSVKDYSPREDVPQ